MERHTLPTYLASNPHFIGKNWVHVNRINGRILIAPDNLALFLQMLEDKGNSGHYHSHYVHKTAHSLKSTFGNSFINTLCHTNQVLPFEGGRVVYQVHAGVVYLMDIEILPREDPRRVKAGFYRAKFDNNRNEWSVNITENENVATEYAAVSGISSDLKDAATLLSQLIPEGYKNTQALQTEGFSFYYNPGDSALQVLKGLPGKWRCITGVAKKSADAMHIASAMTEAHAAGREVKWTLHESGTMPFVGALRVLKDKGVNLDGKQAAFYINPTSNLMMADIYGRRVGIAAGDKGSHVSKPLSARQALMGGNILGSLWMRVSRSNGNWADKFGAGLDESVNTLKTTTVYGSISLSAVLTASGKLTAVGALAAPSLSAGGSLGYAWPWVI